MDADSGGFPEMDALVVANGDGDEDVAYQRSNALIIWLFGCELTNTVVVFTRAAITVLASKRKVQYLKPLCEVRRGAAFPIPAVPCLLHRS